MYDIKTTFWLKNECIDQDNENRTTIADKTRLKQQQHCNILITQIPKDDNIHLC